MTAMSGPAGSRTRRSPSNDQPSQPPARCSRRRRAAGGTSTSRRQSATQIDPPAATAAAAASPTTPPTLNGSAPTRPGRSTAEGGSAAGRERLCFTSDTCRSRSPKDARKTGFAVTAATIPNPTGRNRSQTPHPTGRKSPKPVATVPKPPKQAENPTRQATGQPGHSQGSPPRPARLLGPSLMPRRGGTPRTPAVRRPTAPRGNTARAATRPPLWPPALIRPEPRHSATSRAVDPRVPRPAAPSPPGGAAGRWAGCGGIGPPAVVGPVAG